MTNALYYTYYSSCQKSSNANLDLVHAYLFLLYILIHHQCKIRRVHIYRNDHGHLISWWKFFLNMDLHIYATKYIIMSMSLSNLILYWSLKSQESGPANGLRSNTGCWLYYEWKSSIFSWMPPQLEGKKMWNIELNDIPTYLILRKLDRGFF